MFISADEIAQTIRMIQKEHLDIRTVTMGISLLDCAAADVGAGAKVLFIIKYQNADLRIALRLQRVFQQSLHNFPVQGIQRTGAVNFQNCHRAAAFH